MAFEIVRDTEDKAARLRLDDIWNDAENPKHWGKQLRSSNRIDLAGQNMEYWEWEDLASSAAAGRLYRSRREY